MLKNHIIYNSFSDWKFDIVKAKDSYIWDSKKNKYIDFTSGWNVANLGWNNEEVTKAFITQAKKNTYAPMWTADPIQNKYAELLTQTLPENLEMVGRATGGTEANEEAIKTARAYTGRKKIIGFKDTYHGQSYANFSLGYLPEYIEKMQIGPMVGAFVQLDYPNIYRTNKTPEKVLSDFAETLEKNLGNRDVAGIVTEAGIISGWGSTYVAPQGYLKLVRKVTEKYGTLMILDEVGTGFSRCGELFGMRLEKIVPDIVTFAKGMSNGSAAIGTMVTTKTIAENTVNKANLTSTFGWMPPVCAAAIKTLDIHLRDRIWEKSKKDGEYLKKILFDELKNISYVGDIRGKGMLIGIDIVINKESKEKDSKKVKLIVKKCLEKGLHIVCDMESNIQLMPPLTTGKKILDQGLEILIETVKKAKTH